MKTFMLSSIALFLLCIYSSCTKSSNSLESQAVKQVNEKPNTVNADVDPALTVLFDPATGIQNQPVKVIGTFSAAPIPDCGKLHLFQKVDGQWVKVADTTLSSTVHEVDYEFTPTVSGNDVYEFRVQYIAAGCPGFKETFSDSYFLDVISACNGLTLEGTASAKKLEEGLYEFTVNYTVNTCTIEYDHLKTQGGLTAFTNQVEVATAGYEAWETGNSTHPNTVIKWEETGLLQGGSKTYSVTFQKAWSGSGPVQLTGQWSVKASLNGTEVTTATFDPIIYQ